MHKAYTDRDRIFKKSNLKEKGVQSITSLNLNNDQAQQIIEMVSLKRSGVLQNLLED